MSGVWVGVNFDKTLRKPDGSPIPSMVNLVKKKLKAGEDVRIFTARAVDKSQIPVVQAWIKKQGLPKLKVTNVKDPMMKEIWDWRSIPVEKNTGRIQMSNSADLSRSSGNLKQGYVSSKKKKKKNRALVDALMGKSKPKEGKL